MKYLNVLSICNSILYNKLYIYIFIYKIVVHFIQMRLRQFSFQENLKMKKICREKKKMSKLLNT